MQYRYLFTQSLSSLYSIRNGAIMQAGFRTLASASKEGTSPSGSINSGVGEYEKATLFSYPHVFLLSTGCKKAVAAKK